MLPCDCPPDSLDYIRKEMGPSFRDLTPAELVAALAARSVMWLARSLDLEKIARGVA